MKWRMLYFANGKFFISALVALYVWPFLVNLDKTLGVDPWKLKISIIGSIAFVFYFFVVKNKCPEMLIKNNTRSDYINECLAKDINVFDEFKIIEMLSKDEILKLLGSSSFLYPPENGIYFSKIETVSVYAKLNYDFYNGVDCRLRVLLTILLSLSLISIYTPLIIRVILSLR